MSYMKQEIIHNEELAEYVDKLNEITGSFRMPDWGQMAHDEEWQQMLAEDECYAEWMELQEARETERRNNEE